MSRNEYLQDGSDGATTEVDIYIADGEKALLRLAARQGVLDAEEEARAERFRFDRDRTAYCDAHVLLREMLSRHAHVAPANWRFRRTAKGRPEVGETPCATAPGLRFNLSHTDALVCCAVTH